MELAAVELGAHATVMNVGQGMWGLEWRDGIRMDGQQAEHVREAFGVLSRYYDALGVRAFAGFENYETDRDDLVMKAIFEASSVPVINLESAFYHPCQALGDAATLTDLFEGECKGKKLLITWAPHVKPLPMAVANSAVLMAARLGFDVTVARPSEFALDQGIMNMARRYSDANGASVVETDQLDVAYENASAVYAKSWGASLLYSDPEREARLRTGNTNWMVTEDRMARTSNAFFMHCLPVRRNLVVEDGVIDSGRATHLLQAEYRLHAQKAILEYVWDL
jgi:N-acetylornithine carbamoyltransferase